MTRISISSESLYSRVILGELPRAAEYLPVSPFSSSRFSPSSMQLFMGCPPLLGVSAQRYYIRNIIHAVDQDDDILENIARYVFYNIMGGIELWIAKE
jgi:hypothetical protein